jgi:hypothetical protein
LAVYKLPNLLAALKEKFPRYYRDQLKGLIRLAQDHAEEDLQKAAERAVDFQCVGLGNIEKIVVGVEANRQAIPVAWINAGRALDAGACELRNLSYYNQVAIERQEEQDELADL